MYRTGARHVECVHATRKTNLPKSRAPLTSMFIGSPKQIVSADIWDLFLKIMATSIFW